jgi:uncharacterized membrane protein
MHADPEVLMAAYILALLIGVVAGLRAMTAPAAVSWAAHLGYLPLQDTPLAFLGFAYTPYIFTAAAIGELIADKLPQSPNRKVPLQFGTRIISGGLCGAAIGAASGFLAAGLAIGVVGAIAGTLGGAAARASLARSLGRDTPAALIEDAVAVGGAVWIIVVLA